VIESVEVSDALWCKPIDSGATEERLTGAKILETDRRGKYLIWHLSNDMSLVMHLRMTGTLLYDPDPDTRY
jgi:formamidopyrimidine-DNA glycosylase